MKNVVLLDGVRKILETFMLYDVKVLKTLWKWKLRKLRCSPTYILFQHSKVTALEVLQNDVKYISKEKF